ncbi:hypothetical protein IV73_GL000003 [Weissella kandleri]|uniref:Uncharacterized protein n=1 Tax=Weissella kandleri TaxID=1616 RepID=A0A0R2JDT4_9LACO|nr:hypothetical protein [Weissella kandleri]KRN75523.1 hypothetical protein IV73_GL000003 [Weissella kandleri]
MKTSVDTIQADSFIALINQLSADSLIVGEKTFHTDPGFQVRDPQSNEEIQLPYWDVLKQADGSYWSPLDGDRKMLYNVTTFEVRPNDQTAWQAVPVWYEADAVEQ